VKAPLVRRRPAQGTAHSGSLSPDLADGAFRLEIAGRGSDGRIFFHFRCVPGGVVGVPGAVGVEDVDAIVSLWPQDIPALEGLLDDPDPRLSLGGASQAAADGALGGPHAAEGEDWCDGAFGGCSCLAAASAQHEFDRIKSDEARTVFLACVVAERHILVRQAREVIGTQADPLVSKGRLVDGCRVVGAVVSNGVDRVPSAEVPPGYPDEHLPVARGIQARVPPGPVVQAFVAVPGPV